MAVLMVLLAVGTAEWPADPASSPLERRLTEDASDGRLDEFHLFDAALIASGVQRETGLAGWQAVLRRRHLAAPLQPEPGELLRQLHAELLTGSYDAACSDLRRTLRDGDYNCVTATVLFELLAEEAGLSSTPVAQPAHVCSRLASGEVVQTTCRDWPAKAESDGPQRSLTPLQLCGKIYYNRGVHELERGRFSAAVRLLRLSLKLDPEDATAAGNLLAALNNWALAESQAGRHAGASRLLARCRSLNAAYPPLSPNDLHVTQRWVQSLCEAGDHAAALEVLAAGRERQPAARLYREGPMVVARLWLQQLSDEDRIEEAATVLDELSARLSPAELEALTDTLPAE